MKRAGLVLGPLFALTFLVSACDDENKKKADLLAKTGSSASAAPAASAVATIAPAVSSAAPVAATKPPKECGTGPDIAIDDPDLEAEIRLKLKKPKETSPAALTA